MLDTDVEMVGKLEELIGLLSSMSPLAAKVVRQRVIERRDAAEVKEEIRKEVASIENPFERENLLLDIIEGFSCMLGGAFLVDIEADTRFRLRVFIPRRLSEAIRGFLRSIGRKNRS